jgi:hypothetical protein
MPVNAGTWSMVRDRGLSKGREGSEGAENVESAVSQRADRMPVNAGT